MIKVHVFSMAHNESHLLPYFVRHYRDCFPTCDITIFDNESTDDTASISQDLGCEVIPISSGGFVDRILLSVKNESWKTSQADWMIVCDVDEFLQLHQAELEQLDRNGKTIVLTQGFDMVGEDGNPEHIKDRYPNHWYSKSVCFKRTAVKDINYLPGAHQCNPVGEIQWSQRTYNLFHYRFLSLELMLERTKQRCDRMSEENRQKGFSYHYFFFDESKIRREYTQARRKAKLWRFLATTFSKGEAREGYLANTLLHKLNENLFVFFNRFLA